MNHIYKNNWLEIIISSSSNHNKKRIIGRKRQWFCIWKILKGEILIGYRKYI